MKIGTFVLALLTVPAAVAVEPALPVTPEIEAAMVQIRAGEASCVLVREGAIVAEALGSGVLPLLMLLDENRSGMEGADLVDKIVGRAAAMMAIEGGVRSVTAMVMSEDARDLLQAHGIVVNARCYVPQILDRNFAGRCPMEQVVMEIEESAEGVSALRARLQQMGII